MIIRLAALAACIFWGISAPAFAADADMFKGKTITYIVATGAGGGYDMYARLIARHLQKYLPGARILVKNVPGAGHIIGANTIYASRPDGLTIGMFNTGLIYDQLIDRQGVRFDLAKFSWIGKAANDTRVLMVSKASGIKNIQQIISSKTQVKLAAPGIGSAGYIETRILQDAIKLNAKVVPGFDGNQGEMSMLRNEVVGQVGTTTSLDQFVRNGKGTYVLSLSESEMLPGVPKAITLARNDDARKMLALMSTLSEIGRLTAGPPGIPKPALSVLRSALDKTMKDPALVADAKKLQMPIQPAPGDRVEYLIKRALSQPPQITNYLKLVSRN